MLNRMSFVDALEPDDQFDDQGEKLRPLAALQKLLGLKAPEAAGAVSALRSIVNVRNTFPMHTQEGKTRAAFRELGIDYPPLDSDWHGAWTLILTALWSSLRSVREALQTADL